MGSLGSDGQSTIVKEEIVLKKSSKGVELHRFFFLFPAEKGGAPVSISNINAPSKDEHGVPGKDGHGEQARST